MVVLVLAVTFVVVTVVEVARRPDGTGVVAAWADASGGRVVVGVLLVLAVARPGSPGDRRAPLCQPPAVLARTTSSGWNSTRWCSAPPSASASRSSRSAAVHPSVCVGWCTDVRGTVSIGAIATSS